VPEVFNVSFLERAEEPGVVFGSKAVGEPPLMLAFSVREAIRAAIAAFGDGGLVEIDSPATPERIYWAVEKARGSCKELRAPSAGVSRTGAVQG
jgi:xanthine dehydrogenase large subunit